MNKFLSAILGLALLSSSAAFAASEKICFGIGHEKGERFLLKLTKSRAVVSDFKSTPSSRDNWDGTYPANGELQGRDGITYLSYHISSVEGSTDLLVDESLLESGTKGLAKVRWQGESFDESKYLCRDDQN